MHREFVREGKSWTLRFLNLHLEVRESFLLRSEHPHSEINLFHISYTVISYPFLFQFYISYLDEAGIKET